MKTFTEYGIKVTIFFLNKGDSYFEFKNEDSSNILMVGYRFKFKWKGEYYGMHVLVDHFSEDDPLATMQDAEELVKEHSLYTIRKLLGIDPLKPTPEDKRKVIAAVHNSHKMVLFRQKYNIPDL